MRCLHDEPCACYHLGMQEVLAGMITRAKAKPSNTNKVRIALYSNPNGLTAAEIADAIGKGEHIVRTTLYLLLKKNEVTKDGGAYMPETKWFFR